MIKVFGIIIIGRTRAVINEVYNNSSVEVVYLNGGEHINDKWEFKDKNRLGGGYADKYPRLQEAIRLLGHS